MRIYLSYDPQDLAEAQRFQSELAEQFPEAQFVERPPANGQEVQPNDADKEKIAKALKLASVAVCLVSPNTPPNDWVNYEMASAELEGRGIVGFFVPGTYMSPVDWPDFFRQRHTQYEVLPQSNGRKTIKAIVRAERKGTQTNLFGL